MDLDAPLYTLFVQLQSYIDSPSSRSSTQNDDLNDINFSKYGDVCVVENNLHNIHHPTTTAATTIITTIKKAKSSLSRIQTVSTKSTNKETKNTAAIDEVVSQLSQMGQKSIQLSITVPSVMNTNNTTTAVRIHFD